MSIQHKNTFLPQAPSKQRHHPEQAPPMQGGATSLVAALGKKVINLDPLKMDNSQLLPKLRRKVCASSVE